MQTFTRTSTNPTFFDSQGVFLDTASKITTWDTDQNAQFAFWSPSSSFHLQYGRSPINLNFPIADINCYFDWIFVLTALIISKIYCSETGWDVVAVSV